MTPARTTRKQETEEFLNQVINTCRLPGWNSFTEIVDLPTEMYAALQTGRPEFLRVLKPRALNVAECDALYKALATLIETNTALRKHAQHTAQLVNNWAAAFKQLESTGRKIEDFANFRTTAGEECQTEN